MGRIHVIWKKRTRSSKPVFVCYVDYHHDWTAVSEVLVSVVVKLFIRVMECFCVDAYYKGFYWDFWDRWSCHKLLTHLSELFLSPMLTYGWCHSTGLNTCRKKVVLLPPQGIKKDVCLTSFFQHLMSHIFIVFYIISSLVIWYHACHCMTSKNEFG